MQTKINIKDPLRKSKTLEAAMDSVPNDVSLIRWKDERTKLWTPLKSLLQAVKYFKLNINHPYVDGEGFDCMHGTNRDLFYHTDDSLRKQGLIKISKLPYLGP